MVALSSWKKHNYLWVEVEYKYKVADSASTLFAT